MRDTVCHMNNDIAVAAGGMGGGAHQLWLLNVLRLFDGAHGGVN